MCSVPRRRRRMASVAARQTSRPFKSADAVAARTRSLVVVVVAAVVVVVRHPCLVDNPPQWTLTWTVAAAVAVVVEALAVADSAVRVVADLVAVALLEPAPSRASTS